MSKARWRHCLLALSLIVTALGACKKAPPPSSNREVPPLLDAGASPGAIAIGGGGTLDGNRERDPAPAPTPQASSTAAPLAAPSPLSVADEEAIVRAMCGPGPMRQVAKSWTCHCPSYPDFGESAVEGQALTIIAFHPGRFSAADREEAALGIAGCESGATSSLT